MKKIISLIVILGGYVWAEMPSYQCVDTHEANYISYKGKIEPKVKETSHRSKLNVSLVLETKDKKKYVKNLRVNGNDFEVTKVNKSYIYALEFTTNAMHTWVLFDNIDGKPYLTLSKTYDFIGTPMTSYSLYSCEQVNNTF